MAKNYLLHHNDPSLWKKLHLIAVKKETTIKAMILKAMRLEVKKDEEG